MNPLKYGFYHKNTVKNTLIIKQKSYHLGLKPLSFKIRNAVFKRRKYV